MSDPKHPDDTHTALREDKELQKTQSELKRAADSPQRDKNKQGGQHGEGQGKTGDQRR